MVVSVQRLKYSALSLLVFGSGQCGWTRPFLTDMTDIMAATAALPPVLRAPVFQFRLHYNEKTNERRPPLIPTISQNQAISLPQKWESRSLELEN
ncbi:hypothetical protein Gasu2_10950 [Galdieria sulphuraria]|nr:hypothetical protein Gasu2_10950 [Galdieria sulphuraria]